MPGTFHVKQPQPTGHAKITSPQYRPGDHKEIKETRRQSSVALFVVIFLKWGNAHW